MLKQSLVSLTVTMFNIQKDWINQYYSSMVGNGQEKRRSKRLVLESQNPVDQTQVFAIPQDFGMVRCQLA